MDFCPSSYHQPWIASCEVVFKIHHGVVGIVPLLHMWEYLACKVALVFRSIHSWVITLMSSLPQCSTVPELWRLNSRKEVSMQFLASILPTMQLKWAVSPAIETYHLVLVGNEVECSEFISGGTPGVGSPAWHQVLVSCFTISRVPLSTHAGYHFLKSFSKKTFLIWL